MIKYFRTIILFAGICITCEGWCQQILTDTLHLSEVTVTANKKTKKMMELPTSITSISAERVAAENATTLRNLTGIAPNFYMPEYGSKLTAPVYIRGVGSRINNPSVGLYVDRVPYFEKSAFAFNFADIERIEILRGPQGTLYGRNTMGGIIHVITRSPVNYRQLILSADMGNYGYSNFKGSYNQPLADNLSIMFGAGYTERDGYFINHYTNHSIGSDFTKSGSAKIRYNPIKQLTLTYKFGAERSYENGYPYRPIDSSGRFQDINYNHKSSYHRDMVDNSLTAVFNSNKFVITSVSALQYLKDNQDIDQDFSAKDYYAVGQGVKQHQYTQEIVINNEDNKLLDITAGIFGFAQDANRVINLCYGADGAEKKLTPGNGYDKFNDENNKGMAAFGQATLKNVLGRIDFTAGLRFDNEWNKLHYIYYLNQNGNRILSKDTIFKKSFNQLLPMVAIRYALTPDYSFYATVCEGYRGGGFNTTYMQAEDETYSSESSWNYEVGLKSAIIPKILLFNCAIFYIDWENQQVSQRVSVGGNMYKNAGKTFSKGFEVELAYNPWNNLQVGGNLGYTKAKYVDFQPNVLNELNYKNNYLPFVPRYTYSGYISYHQGLKSKSITAVFCNLSIQGIGKQYWDDANTQIEDAYFLVNGSIGFQTHWFAITFWGKNLFNQSYSPYQFYIDMFKQWYAQAGNPLTCGISVNFKLSGNSNIRNQ